MQSLNYSVLIRDFTVVRVVSGAFLLTLVSSCVAPPRYMGVSKVNQIVVGKSTRSDVAEVLGPCNAYNDGRICVHKITAGLVYDRVLVALAQFAGDTLERFEVETYPFGMRSKLALTPAREVPRLPLMKEYGESAKRQSWPTALTAHGILEAKPRNGELCLQEVNGSGPPIPVGAFRASSFLESVSKYEMVKFSPDGRWLGFTGETRNLKEEAILVVWDVEERKEILETPSCYYCTLAFTRDSRAVVAPVVEDLHMVDIATGAEVWRVELGIGGQYVTSYEFSRDGAFLAVRNDFGGLRVLHTDHGGEAVSFRVAPDRPREARFSPDSGWVAITDGNHLEIWDLKREPGEASAAVHVMLLPILDYRSDRTGLPPGVLGFSEDGRMLAVASFQNVSLWDVRSGSLLGVASVTGLGAAALQVTGVAFTDGDHTLRIDYSGHVREWDLSGLASRPSASH